MKSRLFNLLIILVFTLLSKNSFSQVVIPNGILFQAVARDANNNAASNRNIYAIVNILEKTTNGNSVFSESFKVVSSQEGIFSIVIGQGTRLSGVASLTDINWTKNLHFVNIKIAIEPTLYNPDWTPSNNYVDIGTSQLWAVPYSLSAANANFSDSATTITSILPSTKGGTGVNNNGKNITIANNLTTKGIGDLTIITTGASNITFPTDGLLANTKFVSDRIGADTISLSNRINALSVSSGNSAALKLNISDTATMLSNRIGRDTISLSNKISRDSILIAQNKQAIIDTAAAIRLKLNDKIEVAQFPNLIQPFLANTIFSFQDTMTLSNRIDKKLNISDTAGMLSSYVNLTRPQSLVNKSINGVTPTSLANGFTISGGTNTTTTVTVVGDVTIGGVNSGDQLITLTGDVSGSGTGTFPATINSVGGVSSSTISNLPTRVTTAETNITANTASITTNIADIATNRANITTNTANIASNTASITAEITRAQNAESALDTRVTSNTASITANTSAIALRATIASPSFTGTPTAPTAAPGTSSTQIATTEFVSSLVTVAATPDADATTKGKIQLTGDLAGTAGAPLVNKIGGKAVALGGALTTASSFTTSGNYSTTLTSVGTTNITLPTSGTLATLSGTESLTNKTINGVTPTSLANGFTISGGTNTTTTVTVVGDVTIGGVNSGDQLITLTGDVSGSGTGTFPATINSVGGVSSSTISNLPTRVTTNETNIASNTASITTNIADIATNRVNIITNTTNISSNTASITAEITRAQNAESDLDTRVTSNTASITSNNAAIALRATIASPSFTGTPTAPTAAPGTSTTQLATTEFVSSLVGGAATPDADAITKGKIQLTGDLSGNASAPLVNKIGGKSVNLGGALTTASSFTTSGNYSTTLTSIGTTNITLPTSGTIATLSGTESLTNKTINGVTPTSLVNGFTISGGTNTTTTVTVVGDVTIGGVNSGDQLITLTGDVSGSGTGTFPTTINSVGGVSSSTISNLPTRVTTAETNITANTASITTNTNSIAALDTRVTSNTASITTNIADIATNRTNITTNASNIASNTASITTNTNSIAALDTRVTSNTTSITANTTNIATNIADIALRATIASPSFTGTPTAPTAAPGTSTTQIATTEFVSSIVGGSATPDATASVKGKIKLTNDLGGTADAPTVNSIGGVSSSTISTLPASVTTNTANIASNTASITTNIANIATNTTNIASNTTSITAEIARAQSAENALDTRVTSNTTSITANTTNIATNTADIALRATIVSPSFTGTPTAPTAAPGTSTTQIATTEFVSSIVGGSATPDATASVKGKIKLTNDLGGTADLPTVNSVGGVSSSTISNLPSRVTTAETSISSNTASITAEIARAQSAESALDTRITSNTSSITANTADIATNRTNITTNTTNIAANTASITANIAAIALKANSASPTFTGTPVAPTAADGTNTTQIATTEFVQSALTAGVASGIAASATPDATASVKGKIKLANDLGGTADLPTVNTVGGVSSSTISNLPSRVTTAETNISSNTASITAEIARAQSAESALDTRITSNTSSITANTADIVTNRTNITTNTTNIAANTASITANIAAIALKANSASPTFTGTPIAPTAADGTNTTQIATTEFVQTALTAGVASGIAATATPDATASVKGKIKLTNDLGGTADLPTVNTVGGVSSSTIGILPTLIASNTSSITTNTNSITALDTRVTSNTSSITANTSAIATNATNIATNTTNIATNTNNIALNTANITANTTFIAALDTRVTSNTASITANTSAIAANTSSITTNATNIASNTASITANTNAIALRATIASPTFTGTPSAPTAADGTNTTQIATTEFVQAALNAGVASGIAATATPDATASVKGKIKLTNDLGGTADLPTVNTVGGVSSSTIGTLPTLIASNTSSITTNTNAIALRATIASPSFTGIPTAPTAADGTNTTQLATTEFVQSALNSGVASGIAATATPDATSSVKGKIQLTNDLGGTATAPTVNTVGGISSSTISTLPTLIASNTSSITTNTNDIAALDTRVSSNTASITTNTNNIALKANIASPSFTGVPTAPTATAGTSTTQIATTAFVSSLVTTAATPDADASTKGKIQLTNDLGGTAALPTVNSVGGVSSSTIATLPTSIASNTSSITAALNSIASNTSSITSLTNTVASNTASITSATNSIVANTASITSLTNTVASNTSSISTIFSNTTSISNTVSSNTASITSATTSIAANTASITSLLSDLALKATINSPSFTGTPTVPAPAANSNDNQIATTAFVNDLLTNSGVSSSITLIGAVTGSGSGSITTTIAPNIALTGIPTAPTAHSSTNNTQIATTAYVQSVVSSIPGVSNALNTTSLNEANTIVARDGSGNFAAGEITASKFTAPSFVGTLTGNASNVNGIVLVSNGGTGAVNETNARLNLGLGNVNNTTDLAKPISTLTQAALDLKAPLASPTFTGTVVLGNSVTAGTMTTTDNSTAVATTQFVKNALADPTTITNSVLDATTTVKGKLMLAGDLGGTAIAPSVIKLGTLLVPEIQLSVDLTEAATSQNTSSTLIKRDASGNFEGNIISANTFSGVVSATSITASLVTSNFVGTLTGNATNVSGIVAIENGGTGAVNPTNARLNLGLENVNNTTDLGKPISNLTQAALNLKAPLASPTFTGLVTLGNNVVAATMTSTDNSTAVATTEFVRRAVSDPSLVLSAMPDATTTTKGKIMLAGDLGGTAAAPTVTKLGALLVPDIQNSVNETEAATSINTANTIVKRDANGSFEGNVITANTFIGNLSGVVVTGSTLVGTLSGTVNGTATNVSGIVAIENGGTGAVNPTNARLNLGLENVNNTTDLGKPISNLTQAALNLKAPLASPTFTGLVTLGNNVVAATMTSTDNSTAVATTEFVRRAVSDPSLVLSAMPDATTTTKGKIMLAGDLGGTAAAPTVTKLGTLLVEDIQNSVNETAAATSQNTANTIVKRDANGDFAGNVITANTFNGNVNGSIITGNTIVGTLSGTVNGTATNVSGIVAIENGGTGAVNPTNARLNLGLENVNNTTDLGKPISNLTQAALNLKAPLASPTFTGLVTLGNNVVAATMTSTDNSTAVATTEFVRRAVSDPSLVLSAMPDATTTTKGKIMLAGDLGGTAAAPTVTKLGTLLVEDIQNSVNETAAATSQNTANTIVKRDANGDFAGNVITANTLVGTYSGVISIANGGTGSNSQSGALFALGLDQVNNTTDLNKPISTATQNALDLKVNSSLIGSVNGVASLGSNGKVPSSQLPPFSVSSVNVVANATAMYALTGLSVGAVAIRTDNSSYNILTALPESLAANWVALAANSNVQSVNGATGVVSLAGTANRITVTSNVFDIASTYAGQNTISILGTVSTGTWNANTITIAKGGTGATTANAAFNALAPAQSGNNGKFLSTDGTNTSWSTVAAAGGWGTSGNGGMTDYTTSYNGTMLDNVTYYETTSGVGNTSYSNSSNGTKAVYGVGSWSTSNASVNSTLRYVGTTDASPLNIRVNKARSGRIDWDVDLGQVSYGFGAAKNTWLSKNTAYGGLLNYRGTKNTAFGYEALTSTSVGKDNVAIGYKALRNNQSYNGMVAIGFEALGNFTDVVQADYFNNPSAYALQYGTSYEAYNTAVGYQALKGSATISSNTGIKNTALGYQSLQVNTSGSSNTAVGYLSLSANSTGSNNIAVGEEVLKSNTTGANNTAIGFEALFSSTGNNNVAIGLQSGSSNVAGSQNTYLGANTSTSNAGYNNSTAIGYQAQIVNSNMIQLGNGSITDVSTTGNYNTTNAFISTLGTDATSSTAGGALRIAGGAAIAKKLYVGTDASIGGTLVVGGAQTFTGATTMNGNVSVTGTNTFTVGTGATTLGGTLTVANTATFNNTVSIGGANTFTVGTGATTLNGNLTVAGITTLNGNALLATTPAIGDKSKKIATTEYVLDALTNSNNAWSADGNGGMTDYTTSYNGTMLDNVTYYETTSGVGNTSYSNSSNGTKAVYGVGSWSTSNASVNSTLRYVGTTDASPLNIRVNKARSGRIDWDVDLGQVSYGFGAAKNTWLSKNTAYGGLLNYRGTKNTAFGYEALTSTSVGKDNVAIGYKALRNNQSYNGMVAIGFEALGNFTDVVQADYFNNPSAYALQYGTSYEAYNTAVGYQALKGSATISSNTGIKNTALGYQSLQVNTSGSSNTAVGYLSLSANSTGSNNIAVGEEVLKSNTTGANNTAIGFEALFSSTGNNNVAIGLQSGSSNVAGSQNTYLGANTSTSNAGYNNSTAIGYQAQIVNSNMIQLGNGSVSLVNTSGVLKTTNGTAATTTATGALQVTGGVGITGAIYYGGTLNAASDRRIKKDIANTSYGLKEILQLRPVDYKLISNNENEIGFIAQELKQVLPTVVNGIEGDLEKGELLSVKYQNLIPVLTKSIQELNAQKNEEIAALKTAVTNITAGESIAVKHLKGTSASPVITSAAGSGTNATVKITGTDMSGVIEVTTGDATTANEVLASIQYSTAYSGAPVVIITPGNAATASLMGTSTVFVGNNTNTNFTLNANATPLATKTTYKWYYQVIQ